MSCFGALGFCCCCEVVTPGPWDWYGPEHEETQALAYFSRTAAIYPGTNTGDPSDWEAYPDWYAETFDADFEDKQITSSITPLGGNNVYYYANSGGELYESGTVIMQTVTTTPTIVGIVTELDWDDLDWPIIGPIPIESLISFSDVTPDYTLGNLYNDVPSNGKAAHSGGLVRWYMANSAPGITVKEWNIVVGSGFSYEERSPWDEWNAANPSDPNPSWNYPWYTWPPESVRYPGTDAEPANFNIFAFPITQASQSNTCAGIRNPSYYNGAMPGDYETFAGAGPYTALVEVLAGEFDIDSEFGHGYVNGSTIWSKSKTYYPVVFGFPDYIPVRIDAFDAYSPSNSIAIITFGWGESFEEVGGDGDPVTFTTPNQVLCSTTLSIMGQDVDEQPVFSYFQDIGGASPTYTADYRDFFPRWKNPRALQLSDEGDTFQNRFIVFSRDPFDQSEANDDYGGNAAIQGYYMRCYKDVGGSPALEWSIRGRWGAGQATGEVEFTTANDATLTLSAFSGGDADGLEGNSFAGIELHQATAEKTEYNTTTHILHVYIDITNGHNTVAHIEDLINTSGIFYSFGGTNLTDTITAGDTATPTASFADGDDTPSAVTAPYVRDSSDSYFYVVSFPMLVYDVMDNEIGGTTRRACLPNGASSGGFPVVWRVTHDGQRAEPCGKGDSRWDRQPPGITYAVVGSDWSCYKYSSLELVPEPDQGGTTEA